jgi:small subunit ribosomal protein S2
LEKNLGSISDLTRIPAAVFIIDVKKEHIALAEAKKLGIHVFAMVDTNSDPRPVDFPIPGNDDASSAVELIMDTVVAAIAEGLQERKSDKDSADAAAEKMKEVAEATPAAEAPAEEAAEAPAEESTEEGEESSES